MNQKFLLTPVALRFSALALTVLLLAAVLSGCGRTNNRTSNRTGSRTSGQASVQADKKPDESVSVVTTIFAPYDFARELARDKADVTMLLPPASESHSFEPTPKDIIKIQNCDMFIYVGGKSEDWVDGILSSMDTGGIKIVSLMDCVDMVEEEIVEGMEDDGDEEGVAYDEHIWTSPRNAKQIVRKLSGAFREIDEANASFYQQNEAAYLEKLDELDAAFQVVTDNAARKTIIFGDRFPFRYLADAYGLDYFAAFPGCSSETEPSAATIVFLIDKVKAENIPVVFHAEMANGKIAETISEATGAKVLLLHACHSISKDDFMNGVSYLELMTNNVEALREAIQ